LPLGATPGGKDWCIKALHPSDPLTEVRGIPDQSSVPSVFLNYQTIAEITNPNPAAVGTWAADLALIPHPVGFMYVTATDSVGTTQSSVLNSQLAGAGHNAKYQNLLSFAERWRLAYMSVTVYQDGADLTNQGTCVACQTVVKAHKFYPHYVNAGGATIDFPQVYDFLPSDKPDYTKSQSMPNAYFSRSKEGCYMPLKLTETHQRWHSSGKSIQISAGGISALGQMGALATATGTGVYPFPTLEQAWVNGDLAGGEATSDLCNDVWGFLDFKNLALTTRLQVFVRAGYEIQVQPGSLLSPQQKLSPPEDVIAMQNYFTISRELKDAYPSDYNDAGQIWDVISGVAKTASSVLSSIPHPVAQGIGAAIGGAATVGDVIRRTVAGLDAGRGAGSQGDKALAQAVVEEASDRTTLPPNYFAMKRMYQQSQNRAASTIQRAFRRSRRPRAPAPPPQKKLLNVRRPK